MFGLLLDYLKFETYGEGIEKANDAIYGLVARVWTKDIKGRSKFAMFGLTYG